MLDKLSYSRLQNFKTCRRKWSYLKLLKVPVDTDYTPHDALNFGKAYHEIIEHSSHGDTPLDLSEMGKVINNLFQAGKSHEIIACVKSYFALRKKHPLIMVKAEYEIKHDRIIGYVDTILKEPDGSWWIQDLKTTRSISNDLSSRLAKDSQLNLYASFADDIARDLGLNKHLFHGCRYCVVAKPQFVVKKGETPEEYAARVKPKISEFVIPFHKLNPNFYRQEIEAAYKAMETIADRYSQNNNDLPACNFSSCFNYFSPCEFFSRCHGKNYSEESGIRELTL